MTATSVGPVGGITRFDVGPGDGSPGLDRRRATATHRHRTRRRVTVRTVDDGLDRRASDTRAHRPCCLPACRTQIPRRRARRSSDVADVERRRQPPCSERTRSGRHSLTTVDTDFGSLLLPWGEDAVDRIPIASHRCAHSVRVDSSPFSVMRRRRRSVRSNPPTWRPRSRPAPGSPSRRRRRSSWRRCSTPSPGRPCSSSWRRRRARSSIRLSSSSPNPRRRRKSFSNRWCSSSPTSRSRSPRSRHKRGEQPRSSSCTQTTSRRRRTVRSPPTCSRPESTRSPSDRSASCFRTPRSPSRDRPYGCR